MLSREKSILLTKAFCSQVHLTSSMEERYYLSVLHEGWESSQLTFGKHLRQCFRSDTQMLLLLIYQRNFRFTYITMAAAQHFSRAFCAPLENANNANFHFLQLNKCFFPSQCSKTCGRGIKKRDVYCKSTGSPKVKILPESMCSTDPKPESQQTCVLGRCPKNDRLQWVISSWSEVTWCSFMAHCLPWLLLEMLAQGHTQATGRRERWAVIWKSGVLGEVL